MSFSESLVLVLIAGKSLAVVVLFATLRGDNKRTLFNLKDAEVVGYLVVSFGNIVAINIVDLDFFKVYNVF